MKKRINVVFLINELFINNFEIIYRRMKRNPRFNVTVVTCESVKTDFKNEILSSQVYNFLKSKNIDCIDSYDAENDTHIDLRIFNPDYIFVLTPYDIYRPPEYSSYNLSLLSKVCCFEYGTNIITADFKQFDILNNDFFKNCYCFFKTTDYTNYISEEFNNNYISKKYIPIGCLKVEKYFKKNYKQNCWIKLFPASDALRIVWKPRWTIEDSNLFFEWLLRFKDMSKHENIQLFVLEHPLLRSNLKSKGMLEKYMSIISDIDSSKIVFYNDFDFLDYVLESDVLISEYSSIIPEYSITGNPIILNWNYDALNDAGLKIIDKDWIAFDFETVKKLLSMCKHKDKNNFKNVIFYENRIYKKPSVYLMHYLISDSKRVPKDEYLKSVIFKQNQLIESVFEILKKGYYDGKDEIEGISISKDVFNLLKYWSDELTRINSK